MRLTFREALNSITESVNDGEVEDFIVLSGPNGSGKSNLLEAIHLGAVEVDGVTSVGPGNANPEIKLFKLAELVAATESPQAASTFRDRWIALQDFVRQQIANPPGGRRGGNVTAEQMEQHVRDRLVQSKILSMTAYDRMVAQAGKPMTEFTNDDFRSAAPMLPQVRDPFSLTVGELFLSYHQLRNRNFLAQFRQSQGDAPSPAALTDNEFTSRYGPPPWALLNETLALLGLNYEFIPPDGFEEELQYEPLLKHAALIINTNQLSTGEKTLLAIAMSIYGGTNLSEAIRLPRVLLLDESDASLHPAMIKNLLLVATEIFCKRHGSKVLMTTHSPTTVALAPEESIYVMQRSEHPRLSKVTRDEALANLTVGLPTLSIRIENRRQVFVESGKDQACYEYLFRLLRPNLGTEISLEFIASGNGGQGNRDSVERLVSQLREAGNATVGGIVDRDYNESVPTGVHLIPDRHSIENLIFDPLIFAVFLLRERLATPGEIGIPSMKYFEVSKEQAQSLSDFVGTRIAQEEDDQKLVTVSYSSGFTINVPTFYLNIQGHALEQRLVDKFPGLNQFHNENELKLAVIDRVWAERPEFAPDDLIAMFRELAAA
jgi:ABC-type branched-subunit amino acid transport system ATPase component